ncbi:beta-N-acetylhexosaminidase [Arachnia propionica]|uniref:beta-N-acetylhexosaminidase n=1 Tax=Arachnia propionica TaxID=1750 RepID=A0A3P1T571_9ACTN|nr:beta-N-acetylhexosaminidase [Arachnia propionica]MDO5083172.1 beta-N-acetylhexosaminidase [Arachnia propionica]RRD03946.1 beta-N-acetylhexosaminidase [Arachnia propionica]
MTALLPAPRSADVGGEGLTLDHTTRIVAATEEAGPAARAVQRALSLTTGLPLPIEESGAIEVGLDPELPEEGYRLHVTKDRVQVVAGSPRGAGWAAQTLLQLAPPEIFTAPVGLPVPLVGARIEDAPRFAWRGAMLDPSRHFLPLHDVIDFINWMARHKLNVFHWHLSDDQGWRVAWDKYPRLAEVASWRTKTSNRFWGDDGTPHGGHYTLDQIRAVADYARSLGIETVPELDFPGHVTALLAAYPEFATDPTALDGVAHYPEIHHNVLNFSDEAMDFVHGIWEQVIEATGARHVHIGGDEVPTTHWVASEEVAERAKGLGVEDVANIQRWFTLHMRDWLTSRGVTPIGWDEVVEDGVVEGMICQCWRDAEVGGRAAEGGMQVIMSPSSHTYYDFYQSADPQEPYAQWAITTWEKAYSFDPTAGLSPEAAGRVLGTQFQLWSEFLQNYRHVQYSAWPRGCSLAEVAWSDPTGRDVAEFRGRLEGHLERLAAGGVNYRPLEGSHPWQLGGEGWRRRPPGDGENPPTQ